MFLFSQVHRLARLLLSVALLINIIAFHFIINNNIIIILRVVPFDMCWIYIVITVLIKEENREPY